MNNIARGVLTLFLCIVLVGFGICGAYGTFGGLSSLFEHSGRSGGMAPLLLGCGLVGLVIAWGCWVTIAGMWRKRPPASE